MLKTDEGRIVFFYDEIRVQENCTVIRHYCQPLSAAILFELKDEINPTASLSMLDMIVKLRRCFSSSTKLNTCEAQLEKQNCSSTSGFAGQVKKI